MPLVLHCLHHHHAYEAQVGRAAAESSSKGLCLLKGKPTSVHSEDVRYIAGFTLLACQTLAYDGRCDSRFGQGFAVLAHCRSRGSPSNFISNSVLGMVGVWFAKIAFVV